MSKIDKLPVGWIICESKSTPGRKYFFNKKTGKSSWSQPQDCDKHGVNKKKGKKEKNQQHKLDSCSISKKVLKRKRDGTLEDHTSAKQSKQKDKAEIGPKLENKKPICDKEKKGTPEKKTPTKNLANSRLQKFRASLNAEVVKEESLNSTEESPRKSIKHKISAPVTHTETPSKISKLELKSPTTNDSKCLTVNQSPGSDSFQSTPSPSQFFAANKILYSMKAQLPEEYTCKVKQKDAFADIEEGICNQISEYPSMKHPATPPQFSEASKLVSAIKSKLSYNFKDGDVKKFTSAKGRMEALRASLNNESFDSQNSSQNSLNVSKKWCADEVMDIDCKQWKPIQINNGLNQSKSLESLSKEDVVLVVDTNIFIHELDFIKNVLNSHIKGYNAQPTLFVPWRVINELDRLKDNNNGNGAICKRARSAMDYLYKLLPENGRIKGQSLRDANCHIYPCESPDDEILNCCLQQKERQKVVILLSNDKNLCNKAVTNDVKCTDLEQLKGMLESKPQPINPELFSNVEHYKDTIYQLLSNILENEMRATYNNLWQHVLFKAPPWTLSDVLQCLLKHWIAVFNDVFPRIEHLITDLKNALSSIQSKDPKMLSASEVTNFKELCLDVAKRCQIIPEYMQLAKLTVDRLERKNSSENDSMCERDSEIVVINAFEGVWTVFSSYCAKLCLGLGIPNNIEDKLSTDDPLTILIDRFPVFSNQINTLALALQGVLNIKNDEDPVVNERFDLLETAFKESLSLIYMDSNLINSDNLRIFCIKCRNMLQEAYTKFSQLIDLLDLCKQKIGN